MTNIRRIEQVELTGVSITDGGIGWSGIVRKESIVSDRIEPALSAEEWESLDVEQRHEWGGLTFVAIEENDYGQLRCGYESDDGGEGWPSFPPDSPLLPKLIALANAALPDGDSRKFTRETVRAIRSAANLVDYVPKEFRGPGQEAAATQEADRLRAIADAIASYLPPETP